MGSAAVVNRPMKFGTKDRREFIVQDSEVSFVAINDIDANPIFIGRAKVGTGLDEEKWQIRKITYDNNQGITRIEWPEDPDGIASAEFEFAWASVSPLTITGVTQANPAVVTVSSIGSLQNGDTIVITDVLGMTQLNFDGTNYYTVANIAGNTFELLGIDSSAYFAYSTGGIVNFGEVVTYTYS